MRQKASLLLLLGALGASALAACGDDDKPGTPGDPSTVVDAGTKTDGQVTPPLGDGGGTDSNVQPDTAPPGDPEFTAYVKDLITNHTAESNAPDDFTSKTFVDSENGIDAVQSMSFPATFFQ